MALRIGHNALLQTYNGLRCNPVKPLKHWFIAVIV
jgi:hypothetical protein